MNRIIRSAMHPLTVAIAGGLACAGASAAVIEVTHSGDSGVGSLRWAVETANGNADPFNEIVFASATDGVPIVLDTPIEISKYLIITGNGVGETVIDGDDATSLFAITWGVERVEMSHVSLVNGFNALTGQGGGAITSFAGQLVLGDIELRDNTAYYSGGAVLHAPDSEPSLFELRNCVVSGNQVVGSGASRRGGGVSLVLGAGSSAAIEDCEITDNSAANGGGVSILLVETNPQAAPQTTEIRRSTISGNSASAMGGGVLSETLYNPHLLLIEQSNLSNNTSQRGAGLNSNTPVHLVDSLVADNFASCEGGGVVFRIPNLPIYPGFVDSWEVVNSTISGNGSSPIVCLMGGAGLFITAEAGAPEPHSLRVAHSTIAFNQLTTVISITGGSGAGVLNLTDWPVLIDHSIVTDNPIAGGTLDHAIRGQFEVSWSLIGPQVFDSNNTHIVEGPGLQYVTTGRLQPLADNGGWTRTHKLQPDSPARTAGDPDFSPPPALDQRADPAFPRVANDRIDIGAFESQLDIVFANGFGDYHQPQPD